MSDQPELIINCPRSCGLHPDRIGEGNAIALLALRQKGSGAVIMTREATRLLGRRVHQTSVQRHLHHYREKEDPNATTLDLSKKAGDLEILDLVIQRGAANSMNWKPGIKDVIEAMKLKMQMTGNSAFDDLIALFDGAELPEDLDEAPESPEAVAAPGEREWQDEDPLAEPSY